MNQPLTSSRINPKISNLPGDLYGIYINGELTREVKINRGDEFQTSITVDGNPKDLVIMSLTKGY